MQGNPIIIDRKDEIETVREHIRQGKSLHVYGPEGVGKTALIDYIYRTWGEIGTVLVPVYCRNSGTLEQMLETIAKFLLAKGKKLVDIDYERRTERLVTRTDELSTVRRRDLRNMVFPHIKRGQYCIIFDHLENVSQRTNSFFKALYDATPVISASREGWERTKCGLAGTPQYALCDVPKLEVKNLDKEAAFNLMEILLCNTRPARTAGSSLFEDAYAVTQGNPKMIEKVFARTMDPKCLHDSARK